MRRAYPRAAHSAVRQRCMFPCPHALCHTTCAHHSASPTARSTRFRQLHAPRRHKRKLTPLGPHRSAQTSVATATAVAFSASGCEPCSTILSIEILQTENGHERNKKALHDTIRQRQYFGIPLAIPIPRLFRVSGIALVSRPHAAGRFPALSASACDSCALFVSSEILRWNAVCDGHALR